MMAISGSGKPRWAQRATTQITELSCCGDQSQSSVLSFPASSNKADPSPRGTRAGVTEVRQHTEQEAEPVLAGKERQGHQDPLNSSEPEAE